MKGSFAHVRRWLGDENAQATTEYVLLLFMTVSVILLIAKSFLQPFSRLLLKATQGAIEGMLIKSDLHYFPL